MAKHSGSKGSRGERRAGKQRAQRAREHGLPERRVEPLRARAATPEPYRSREDEEGSRNAPAAASRKGAVPTLVWVVGGALAILAGVYVLSQKRDEALNETRPAAEPTTLLVSAVAPAQAAPLAEPPETAPAAVTSSAAAERAPVPAPPRVVSPPRAPKVPKPLVAAPQPPAVVAPAEPKPPVEAPRPIAPVSPTSPADSSN